MLASKYSKIANSLTIQKESEFQTLNREMPEMPREKLVRVGASNLKDWELLALLMRTGIKGKGVLDFSKDILKKYDLHRLSNIKLEELTKIKGIGKEKASTILASIELSRRILDKPQHQLPSILEENDALTQLCEFRNKKKEYLVALYLNARSDLVHKEVIAVGIIDGLIIHPREVFDPAIRYLASSIIIAHNHPSGDLTPSVNDIEATKRLISAGEILGIELMDHLIITKTDQVSVFDWV